MEIVIGALALFVTFLIVPAFLLALGFAAAIPLAGIGLLGNLYSHWKARREGPQRRPLAPAGREQIRDQPRDEEIPRVA